MSDTGMERTRREWRLPDEAATVSLAQHFGQALCAPLVIYLQGDLGAGKTTFARALIQGLGYPGKVKSPTYGLLESYQAGGFDFLHLDLYRIESPAELEYLALSDQFTEKGVLLVEWPEKAFTALPSADIRIIFKEIDSGRSLVCESGSVVGAAVVRAIAAE
jgi:tRNA threonylcarbamoyladenosine biosynthesis protein TsaE